MALLRRVWVLASLYVLPGCVAEARRDGTGLELREPEPLATGKEQQARLCGRGDSDIVIDVFCRESSIRSFAELRAALGLADNENGLDRGFALTGHSTSLVSHAVSAINPRIIFVQRETEASELISLAFARGEQFAEMVARDRRDGELRFYLATFTQNCNESSEGCLPGDLLTAAVESEWNELNVYGEEDLANTPRDCRVCHQPDGPGTRKLLRMQEFEAPWNHWLWRQAQGGRALLHDYYAAKGDEPLASVPGEAIISSQPGLLSFTLFSAGSGTQPNAYVSADIEREVMESAELRGGNQPTDNSIPGQSKTWDAIYERAKRGEAISVPYHDVKVTDAQKLADMTRAYADYRSGALPRRELPDIRDIYPDDPKLRAEIGLVTEPGLNAEAVLLQACAQCHNARLDQSLSRARFSADLSMLDGEAKDSAIARLRLPHDNPAAMPPKGARALSEEARDRLIELLRR